MAIRKNRHSVYDLEYHLVVCTKYRHAILDGDMRKRLIEITKRIFEQNFNRFVTSLYSGAALTLFVPFQTEATTP